MKRLLRFFDASRYSGFSEGCGTITLPEEQPAAIKTLVTWIYTGRISSELIHEELWVLGDKLRVPEFQYAVMFLMFDKYSSDNQFVTAKAIA